MQTTNCKRRTYKVQPGIPDKSKSSEDGRNRNSIWKGLIYATIYAVFYFIDAIFVKKMKNLDPIQLAFYRFIALFVMSLPEVVKCGKNPFGPKGVRVFLILRGALGGIGICFAYTAYRFLPLGESFIITCSIPIFVTFAACIFLNEPCGFFQSVLVVLTVIGIIFTAKVPSRLLLTGYSYTSENTYGLLAAILALLCRTCMMIFVRKAKEADYSVMMFNYGWVSVLQSFILFLVIADFKWHTCGMQWLYILLTAIINYVALTFLTLSLKCELAGPVSTVIGGVRIILAFLWQTVILKDLPDHFTIAGAIIVVFCFIMQSIKQWVASLSENSICRKNLKWMLF